MCCGEITRAYSRFSNRPYTRDYMFAKRVRMTFDTASRRVSTKKFLSLVLKITRLKRALSPRKRHRCIVAEETYGRAQQRASFYRDNEYFMRTFLPLHYKLYCTDANLCCFLFERELCTMPTLSSLRASVRAIGTEI